MKIAMATPVQAILDHRVDDQLQFFSFAILRLHFELIFPPLIKLLLSNLHAAPYIELKRRIES